MLRFEDSLPRLPVPTLEETAKRYLKSLHPLLSKDELENTRKIVEDFIKPGSIGEKLQKRLEARREDPKHKNWLHEWWTDSAYLAYRDPVVPYVSYFFSHRDDRQRRHPAKRAAALSLAMLEFKKQVEEGTLEPEYSQRLPLSMASYQLLFNACRIPAKDRDYPVRYEPQENKHLIVVRKNRFYKVLHEIDGQPLNASELEQQFRRIIEKGERGPGLGFLTTENRDVWAAARSTLLSVHPSNATALQTIESASLLVALDDATPVTLEERARQYWHGDGSNRWFDKPLQLIVNDNGASGFLSEHSMVDGVSTYFLNDYACRLVATNHLDFSNPHIRSGLPEPTAVQFHINEQVTKDIHRAASDFDRVVGQHELRVQAYQAYGKGFVKKLKCSPDAYVQMIIQLAYYKMFGVNRPTYESAATRRFQLGRTETCRSVSDESVAFCRAMADPAVAAEACVTAFWAAIRAQVQYQSDASAGKGVDRHFLGLRKCLKGGEEVPRIFTDGAYKYSGTWFLSTSQLSSVYFNGYGWSQVVDEGFGIAYMIQENRYVSLFLTRFFFFCGC